MVEYHNPFATTSFVLPDIVAGMVVVWSGSIISIPSGWALCDGNNGTPDLRDQFLEGTETPGGTGGAASHVHTETYGALGHQFPFVGLGQEIQGAPNIDNFSAGALEGFTSDATSSLPTYYALAFIMRL